MNRENIQKAIDIMERAAKHDAINMINWQMNYVAITETDVKRCAKNEAELHSCGNKACFAGYLAISPEFQADGGSMLNSGVPEIQSGMGYLYGESAIAEWLGIDFSLAQKMVLGEIENTEIENQYSLFYDKPWSDVRAEDIIQKLEMILEGKL